MTTQGSPADAAIRELLAFPLLEALFGRRARRFGLGMEVPSGPLAFKSRSAPMPLSELEQAVLIVAATGVSGWHFGIPHTPSRPNELSHYSVRLTGRTVPTGAGIGTPVLFYTDDNGTYLVNLRDIPPSRVREYQEAGDFEGILAVCRGHRTKLGEKRLDIRRDPRDIMEHNLWVANQPGTTLLIPATDLSEYLLALLMLLSSNGYFLFDDYAKRPAGDLEPFFRLGLLDSQKAVPLSFLEQATLSWASMELAFMAHNAVLTMQAMGLGGWFFTGMYPWSILGGYRDEGVQGLGFRFVRDERWTLPNPVGLDGHYEGLCPPYQRDMRSAVEALVTKKFGPGGTYDPATGGAYKRTAEVKASVSRYSRELVESLGEMAQYVYDAYGKFPATIPTILVSGYVQAQHIDLEYYETHFKPGAYLPTHTEHMVRWHGGA
jgi:hypothetical protein